METFPWFVVMRSWTKNNIDMQLIPRVVKLFILALENNFSKP